MNRAEEILLHQATDHLFIARYAVESAFDSDGQSEVSQDAGLELGNELFEAIGLYLKFALDLDDMATFKEVERKWARMFDDIWLPGFPNPDLQGGWSERGDGDVPPQLLALLRRREILRLGLLMWTLHLLERPHGPDRQQRLAEMFNWLASRFSDIEFVLDAFTAATSDREDSRWTGWLLDELPSEEAHTVPTSEELLRTTLILLVRLITPDEPGALQPRDWFGWRRTEIDAVLDQLAAEGTRWSSVLGIAGPFGVENRSIEEPESAWKARIARLRELFEEGGSKQKEQEREVVRAAPIDPQRIEELRRHTLRSAATSRVLRDTIDRHSGIDNLSTRPDDFGGLVSRTWAPRSFFTQGSRVVGLDMMGRDLARPGRDAERMQLTAALPDSEPACAEEDESFKDLVTKVISQMRSDGLRPTLLVLPISWQAQQELGLSALGTGEVQHELVPYSHSRAFSGVIDDVLVLDLVGMPEDKLWILDIGKALRYEEWPSDEDSGLRFEVTEFPDIPSAKEFLEEHPEVAPSDQSQEEAIETLRERVLISLHLCWRIVQKDSAGARSVSIPEDLRG